MHELSQALDAFEADANIGCIVMTGSDKAFAAGADIKEMADKTFVEAFLGDFAANWHCAATVRKPVIAAVAGFALGGGRQFGDAVRSDHRRGQRQVRPTRDQARQIPGIGGTQRLTRAVGKAKAMDLILIGRMMDVQEAERSGLVARIVPPISLRRGGAQGRRDDRVDVAAFGARRQGGRSRLAFETSLAEGVRFERRMFHSLFATADQKEGMAAFIAKRPAKFENK